MLRLNFVHLLPMVITTEKKKHSEKKKKDAQSGMPSNGQRNNWRKYS